jgi:hypothetical protein
MESTESDMREWRRKSMEGNQQNEENKEIQIDKKTEAAHLYHSI